MLRYAGPFNFLGHQQLGRAPASAPTPNYLFCNNDIEAIEPGWLEHMLAPAQQSGGMVGAQLLYPDRATIQHAGVCGRLWRGRALRQISVPAARPRGHRPPGPPDRHARSRRRHRRLPAQRRDAFEAIGGYDETLAVGFW